MTNEVKITKAMVLNTIMENIDKMEFAGDVKAADVENYINVTLAQMAAKNEKAKARAAEKRAAADELKQVVASVLTGEFQTREQIFAQIDGEDLTVAKIGARLTALVNDGVAIRSDIKVDKRTVKGYALAEPVEPETV